jgi:hypothetical protein
MNISFCIYHLNSRYTWTTSITGNLTEAIIYLYNIKSCFRYGIEYYSEDI